MIVNKPKKKKKQLSRYSIMLIIMTIVFTIITLKLVYIQIYKHDDYEEQANNTSTRFVSKKAPRGEILDQKGNILATNIQTYALTYTKTTEADKAFYSTMDSIFKILSENGQSIQDDLKLKLDENNNWYIDYENTSEELVKSEDLRFKKDRGLDAIVEKALKYNSEEQDLTDEQIEKINKELYKITPEEVFYYLVDKYKLIDLIYPEPTEEEQSKINKMKPKQITKLLLDKGYTYEQLRSYIVIKDSILMKSYEGYKSINICKNLRKDVADIIYQKLNDLPGISVTLEPTRSYPYGSLGSSVLGYISSINEANEETYELRGYDASTDLVGAAGIESAFEEQLRGVTGGTTVKVNSAGRVTQELFKLESYPGNNVHLSIDKNLQYVAEKSFEENLKNVQSTTEYINANRGAVVAVEAKTGRILALASLPNYDPNIFAISGQLTGQQYKQYFSPDYEAFGSEYISKNGLNVSIDDLFPKDQNGNREDIYDLYPRSFYNYATQGLVPPGSTFKPMTAIAGLESGIVLPNETIYDDGKFDEHSELFNSENAPHCWLYDSNGIGHGAVDVESALEVSCNYYFYELGYRMYHSKEQKTEGLNVLANYGWKFGLGVDPKGQQKASTGIEINENFGQIYNYSSYRNLMVSMSKFKINEGVESGSLRGYSFVPFDYSANEDDSEELKEAKIKLKDKIYSRLKQIDPDDQSTLTGSDAFAETLYEDIRNVMDNSQVYAENVKKYEEEKGYTVDLDNEVIKIANAISLYIIYDLGSEMTSPAQEIYASIGQGINTFTPLQLAQYISTFVNGGTRYKLHLVDKITDPEGNVIQEYGTEVLDSIQLKQSTIDVVKEGMRKVNDESGTASNVFIGFPIETAGKTGTADFSEKQADIGRSPFATYVGFAPVDDPEIVVAIVMYDAGHGGSSSAYVAKAIYEQYFKERILEINPSYDFLDYVDNLPKDNKNK